MKNIYEVLQQKEADIDRLREELQALRIVAPLLEGELEVDPEVASGSGLGPDPSHAISPAGETAGSAPPRPSTKPVWSWGRLNPKRDPRSAA